MAILQGDPGKAAVGTLKTFTISYPTLFERLQGTPLSVPNVASIPGTAIDTYTVQTSDIPTINGSRTLSARYCAQLTVSGKNNDSVNRTLNYQINKNGTSAVSGTFTANAGQMWTVVAYFRDVTSSDVIDVYVWCTASTLINYDFLGIAVIPTGVQLSSSKTYLYKDVTYVIGNNAAFTNATNQGSSGNWYLNPYYFTSVTTSNAQNLQLSSGTWIFPFIYFPPQAGSTPLPAHFGRVNNGDILQGQVNFNHATLRSYFKQFYPTSISFREVLR